MVKDYHATVIFTALEGRRVTNMDSEKWHLDYIRKCTL